MNNEDGNDNEFFNNFIESEYKASDPLDEFTRMYSQNKFDKQREVVDDSIQIINEFKTPAFNKVESKFIHDKSHLLEFFIPENEELYKYLTKNNHKFT